MGGRRAAAFAAGCCLALAVAGGPGAASATDEATATAGDEATATATEDGPAPAGTRPVVRAVPDPPVVPVTEGAAVDPEVVEQAVADDLENDWLGERVSITVRDAVTGEHILDRAPDREVTPASLTKLLTAAAIVTALPLDYTFDTTVVAGVGDEGADDIYLVSGGDMLLDTGEGDPEAVAGRAGLADLADQVAQVRGGDAPPVTLHVDPSYGAGELAAPGWSDYWLDQGFTGPITMLGLARDRAFPYHPAPRNPTQVTAAAFRDALEDAGVEVAGDEEQVPRGSAPADGELLATVSSAPVRDVLTLAMADSDNAMVEQLARQAALRDGVGAERDAINAWVVDQVSEHYGIDVTGVQLSDTSGLSDGTTIPVRVVGDVLVAGAGGDHPDLQQVLEDLPIAGYTGTLYDRFLADRHAPSVGIARAKTGSLPGVTALGGTLVTQDDRLLIYAIVADRFDDRVVLEARAVTEDIVTELARCGC